MTNIDSDETLRLFLGIETPTAVQSLALESYNIQATSKGFDQTARMRRLI